MKSGKEAIEIWRKYFAKVMSSDDGDRETSGCQMDRELNGSKFSQLLCEPISREEVLWVLNAVTEDAASRA